MIKLARNKWQFRHLLSNWWFPVRSLFNSERVSGASHDVLSRVKRAQKLKLIQVTTSSLIAIFYWTRYQSWSFENLFGFSRLKGNTYHICNLHPIEALLALSHLVMGRSLLGIWTLKAMADNTHCDVLLSRQEWDVSRSSRPQKSTDSQSDHQVIQQNKLIYRGRRLLACDNHSAMIILLPALWHHIKYSSQRISRWLSQKCHISGRTSGYYKLSEYLLFEQAQLTSSHHPQ